MGGVPTKHPLMAWLVEHVSDVITKYVCGTDGRTGYERLFGKHVHKEGLAFGERIMWKCRGTEMKVVIEARWLEGLWLDRRLSTPRHALAQPCAGRR